MSGAGNGPEAEQGAPPDTVGRYLVDLLGDGRWQHPELEFVVGGRSNLTYRVRSEAGSVVLRRPPLGNVLPTAHDMGREYRVMAALAGTSVPVPAMLGFCEDTDLLGAPFYVMQDVAGAVVRGEPPPGMLATAEQRRAMSETLVRVLVDLHAVDRRQVGLARVGKPDGYLQRQLDRWGKQWEATRIEQAGDLDGLLQRLIEARPGSPPSTLVHGDYRLDNVILTTPGPEDDPQTYHPEIAAVLDWEMATVGDPLADLGLLLVYWSQADDAASPVAGERAAALVVPSATRLEGFATREEVAGLYARDSGRDIAKLPWYVAFGFFKLAVVCAGIAARGRAGAMIGEGFTEAGERVAPLATLGHRALDGDLS